MIEGRKSNISIVLLLTLCYVCVCWFFSQLLKKKKLKKKEATNKQHPLINILFAFFCILGPVPVYRRNQFLLPHIESASSFSLIRPSICFHSFGFQCVVFCSFLPFKSAFCVLQLTNIDETRTRTIYRSSYQKETIKNQKR